jgi:hypothetical protein
LGARRACEGATGPVALAQRRTVTKIVPVVLDDGALLETAPVAVRAGRNRTTFRIEGAVSGSIHGILPVNVPFPEDRTIPLQDLQE